MKKKILKVSILLILISAVLMDVYLRIEYDSGLYAYIKNAQGLTEKEREWLVQHGPLIYSADQNAPPLRYVDPESSQFKGIVVDYLRALSIELGVEINMKPLVWEEALQALKEGKTDICDMYPSAQRREIYLFSDPIYNQKSIILTLADNFEIQGVEDLSGIKVAVQDGDYAMDFLRDNTTQTTFVYTDDYKASIRLLLNGEVAAIVGDEPVITYFLDEMGREDACRIVEEPLFELESILAVPKSEEVLVGILNKGIYNLKRKETMEKIYQKWFGISAPFIKDTFREQLMLTVVAALFIVFILVYLFYSWNRMLVIEVDKRTKALDLSRKSLQRTFDSMSQLMVVMDREGHTVSMNRAFKEAKQAYAKSLLNHEVVQALVMEAFEHSEKQADELRFAGKIIELETCPLEFENNSVVKVLVTARDITQVRISEEKLLQSNKMTAVGQLAAGVAHEIRNPLGTIRNFTYILKNDLTHDPSKRMQSINIIEKSVEKASRIIENLLNFSSISGDDVETTNIREFVENILSLERKYMTRQNVKVTLVCEADLECVLNQESLKHVIINLISNAVEAMPQGGDICITCVKSDQQLVIRCMDTGVGIESADLENIFNPFFTTKQRQGGTGLGLYVAYNEVKKLGGDIRVESDPGKGTTFTVIVPLESEANHENTGRG